MGRTGSPAWPGNSSCCPIVVYFTPDGKSSGDNDEFCSFVRPRKAAYFIRSIALSEQRFIDAALEQGWVRGTMRQQRRYNSHFYPPVVPIFLHLLNRTWAVHGECGFDLMKQATASSIVDVSTIIRVNEA